MPLPSCLFLGWLSFGDVFHVQIAMHLRADVTETSHLALLSQCQDFLSCCFRIQYWVGKFSTCYVSASFICVLQEKKDSILYSELSS